jgi:hypothetical protein
MHLLIDAIAAAKPFRYGTWMRQAVYRAVSPVHPFQTWKPALLSRREMLEKCHAPKVEGEEGEEEEGKTMAGYKIHCTDQFDVFFIEMN